MKNIKQLRSNLSVSRLSKLFGVAKSSFYQSLKTSQNADKVNQITRKHGLKARSYKRKPYKKPSIAPNNLLKRDFKQSAPNQAWAGDITYLQAGGKTVCLAVIMDLYARRIIA
jgi:transposase InsO family protein